MKFYKEWMWIVGVVIVLFWSGSIADLFQVNRSRTLCSSGIAEFYCSQYKPILTWRITINGVFKTITFHHIFDEGVTVKRRTVDYTPVVSRLIFINSTFFESSLTIVASLSASIQCDPEIISYRPINSKEEIAT